MKIYQAVCLLAVCLSFAAAKDCFKCISVESSTSTGLTKNTVVTITTLRNLLDKATSLTSAERSALETMLNYFLTTYASYACDPAERLKKDKGKPAKTCKASGSWCRMSSMDIQLPNSKSVHINVHGCWSQISGLTGYTALTCDAMKKNSKGKDKKKCKKDKTDGYCHAGSKYFYTQNKYNSLVQIQQMCCHANLCNYARGSAAIPAISSSLIFVTSLFSLFKF
ncbi:uncharacterized protein LOC141911430 [Tubulanus polymorphus]|uniref:uncharacterized protein LOC141911430 n=1 Tax=Tubulanus polymorphus TaxID=672921 RepID=UPI003DA68299